MKTITLFKTILLFPFLLYSMQIACAQTSIGNKMTGSHNIKRERNQNSRVFANQKNKIENFLKKNNITVYDQGTQNKSRINNKSMMVCADTIITVPQTTQYFCFGQCSDGTFEGSPDFEIASSFGAAATSDSEIVWLITYDKDGPGPLSAWPDSLVQGHDLRNSTNRAPLFPGFTPIYLTTNPMITPWALHYPMPQMWSDSGKSLAFTPVAFDSGWATHHLYEIDSCFGYGQPFLKTFVKAIHTDHYYSCDSGVNKLHLIPWGGLPGYNHYNGYGDSSNYTVIINGSNYTMRRGDTLSVNALAQNIISIYDSLSLPGLAGGCVIYYDTLVPFPPLIINGLAPVYYDNDPAVTFTVSPKPAAAMRIDFLASDPVSDGIYMLDTLNNALGDLYPLGNSVGPGNISDIPSSFTFYNLPLDSAPFKLAVTNDIGSGWQDSTCNGLTYNGHLQLFDASNNIAVSPLLYPIGDGQCGGSGNWIPDTFGTYHLNQYNKTQISTTGNPASLSSVDSAGNATFSPSIAGPGTFHITFSYNENRFGLCDKDTVISITVLSSVGVKNLLNAGGVLVNNPVHDQLIIKPGMLKIDQIELTDMSGKYIMSKHFEIGIPIDVSSLAAGAYLIKMFDARHETIGEAKILKN